MSPRLFGMVLLFAFATSAYAVDLDSWVDRELIPSVNEQLLTHPRFKGETLVFVVLKDSAPAPISSELALSIRDRLLQAALDTSGIHVGSSQGGTKHLPAASIDCMRDDVHYYIGLELKRQIDDSFELSVRALDLEDRSWVGGFSKSWRGRLSHRQMRASQRSTADQTFLGSRDVPFTVTQTDLLAQHIAYELSCGLLRQTNGEYVVAKDASADDGEDFDGAVELISNNIAAHSAFEISTEEQRVNAQLSAKAHQIDGALYQYWLTVTPNGKDEVLTSLSASAYVVLPNTQLADGNRPTTTPAWRDVERESHHVAMRRAVVSVPNTGDDAIIGPLRVSTPTQVQACRSERSLLQTASFWSHERRCSLLEAATNADAVVFFLEHQPQLGLVRLGGDDCRDRTTARVVRRGDALQFPIAWFREHSGQMRETTEWLVEPRVDTYYAIAVADARSARRLANHIDKLPMRCGANSRPGLTGAALSSWLDDFAMLAAQSADHFDWRALQLKDVY